MSTGGHIKQLIYSFHLYFTKLIHCFISASNYVIDVQAYASGIFFF